MNGARGRGEGFNCNMPLPESIDGEQYRKALAKAIVRIEAFKPQFLLIALGLDTAKGDPTGTWHLLAKDFEANGRIIGQLGLPTLVIQEGGYRNRTLGTNCMNFFRGLVAADHPRVRMRFAEPTKRPCMVFAGAMSWSRKIQKRIGRLVEITGFFNTAEMGVAQELVNERLTKGDASGYFFVMAEHYGRLVAYTCYGPIAGSANSFDLYWIAVHPDFQRRGMGRRLIKETERLIHKAGGRRIYVETSQRAEYASTRIFYENSGYRLEAVLADFYAPGDGKAIYSKILK